MADETKDPLREALDEAIEWIEADTDAARTCSLMPDVAMAHRSEAVARFRAALSAPEPEPQGWEEIVRLVDEQGRWAIIRATFDPEEDGWTGPYARCRECGRITRGEGPALHRKVCGVPEARERLLRALRASVSGAPTRLNWQCSGCRWGFIGEWQKTCPACGREDYWTGSVHPEAKLWSAPGVSAGGEGGDETTIHVCATCAKFKRGAYRRGECFVDGRDRDMSESCADWRYGRAPGAPRSEEGTP